jgi:osmotically-inducible protein OsmY
MIKKLGIGMVFLVSAGCLSGCIPAAFIAGSSAGGALAVDKRNVKTIVQDRDTANIALKTIGADPALRDHTHIVIAGFNQVMLMVGQAETEGLRDQAYNVLRSQPNVKRIYNEVTIGPSASKMVQAQDSWITTKAKSAMLMEKGLHSGQVKVVTEGRVVYLMGIVTPKQSDLAAGAASQVVGVKKVVKLFEYEQ